MFFFKYIFMLLCIICVIYVYLVNNISNTLNKNIITKTIENSKRKSEFRIIYDNSKIKLYEQSSYVKECVKNKLKKECNLKSQDYITMLPNEMTKPTEIYHIYSGGYSSLIEPKCDYDGIEIIVGIPCGPPQLIGRISIRETYIKENIIDGFKAKYIFLTGLAPEPYYSYPLNYLKEESNIFNDILVFDFVNTYHNITLLMMSTYKWILDKHPNIKYFIRSNLDVLFFPRRMNGLLRENKYDVISEISRFRNTKVYYPQGAFYVFSIKTLNFIYNQSFIHKPIHRWDDVYYGEIISSHKDKFSVYDMGGMNRQMKWDCSLCSLTNDKNVIVLHPFFPASIFLFYNYNINQ